MDSPLGLSILIPIIIIIFPTRAGTLSLSALGKSIICWGPVLSVGPSLLSLSLSLSLSPSPTIPLIQSDYHDLAGDESSKEVDASTALRTDW